MELGAWPLHYSKANVIGKGKTECADSAEVGVLLCSYELGTCDFRVQISPCAICFRMLC